jgi:hypothetical protein
MSAPPCPYLVLDSEGTAFCALAESGMRSALGRIVDLEVAMTTTMGRVATLQALVRTLFAESVDTGKLSPAERAALADALGEP